jgi:hypothetical protein
MIFKKSVRTAKKTQLFTITKINWLTLFKEIIAVYSENHAELLILKADDAYNYHSALKGFTSFQKFFTFGAVKVRIRL